MWRRLVAPLILGLIAAFVILLLPSGPASGRGIDPPASSLSPALTPDLADGLVLVAGRTVDFQWTAGDHHGGKFEKWQLHRYTLPSPDKFIVLESTELSAVFHRDTVSEAGKKYRYEVWNYECWPITPWPSEECGWRKYHESVADTSILSGQVTRDVQVVPGIYTGTLFVQPGVALQMGSGTKVNGQSQFTARGGTLNLDGVEFERTSIQFGQWDRGTSGKGGVRGCTFVGSSGSSITVSNDSANIAIDGNTFSGAEGDISLNGQSSADITGNKGAHIWLDGTATAEIAGNTLSHVLLRGANQATVERNIMSEGVRLMGSGSQAEVRRNTITTDQPTYYGEEGKGILAYDGTEVTAEDNTLVYTGPESEYGTLVINAEGSATLTARRNAVMGGIGVWDQVTATLTDNVITKGSLQVKTPGIVEITGNTIQHALLVNFYREVPATATITNNCFRWLSVWVYVEGRSAALNLRGNYWGSDAGPRFTGTSKPVERVQLKGPADYDPWDRAGAMCMDRPPPPPVTVASLELTANPEKLIPDGIAMAEITVRARDAAGAGIPGVPVPVMREPAIGNWWLANGCETGADGTCKVFYIAPTVQEAASGVSQVVISGSAGGQTDSTVITLDYLRVAELFPSHGTRNADLRALFLAATFDRAYLDDSIKNATFAVSSSVHFARLPCVYEDAGQATTSCKLQDLSGNPKAVKGLILTARLKGGVDGIRGVDGSFMPQDVTWQIYTTPELAPRIVPVQVADGADLIGSKPLLVRVLGGLSEDTELDWVEANVKLTYEDLGASFTRPAHRFYPGQSGLNEAYLRGNSANFSSKTGEAPLAGPNMAGEHGLLAWVEPVNQLNPPDGVPRRYNTEAAARVRPLGGDYARLLVAMYPVVPTDHPLHEFPYPWQIGQEIAGVRASPALIGGRSYAEKWTPLWGIEQTTGTRAMEVWAPLIPHPKNDGAWYLAKLVRHADWQTVPLVPSGVYVLMLVPWQWMSTVNYGTPTYHGPSHHVCLTAVDAPAEFNPAATLAWCIGHVHGLADARRPEGYILRGYDLDRDRLVDNEFSATGYRMPVMGFDRTGWGAELANLWMDTAGYSALIDQMAGASASAALAAEASPLASTITVGGEVVRQSGLAERGAVDIVETPARGVFPAPGGTGEYRLRLLGAGGALLAEHPFTPGFATLREGLDYATFLFNVPAPDGVRSVSLLRGTSTLTTTSASANPPKVTIQQPVAGSYSGAIATRWTGSDADLGTTLQYTVLFSPDNGTTWQAVALATEAQQLTLDTAQYPNCTQCRLKVIASDGFYSAEATSVAFSAANPPRVDLVWPPDGAIDAPVWPEIRATFRDAMDAGSIDSASFTLVDSAGHKVPGTVTYSPAARTAALAPAGVLAYGETYIAHLARTIRTTGGAALSADFAWRFTVERAPISYSRLPLILRVPRTP